MFFILYRARYMVILPEESGKKKSIYCNITG